MTWDEKAEDHAVAHHTYDYLTSDENAYYTSGFARGARWQREALLSDESVERAARVVTPRLYWNYADWGEASEGDREEARIIARKVLTAAIGDNHE